ncbi:MAG: STAS domain-containing protein, partial [Kofleriaceae bacterium]
MNAWQLHRRGDRLVFAGRFTLGDAEAIWRELERATAAAHGRLDIDLRDAETVDGAIMPLLVELRASLAARGDDRRRRGGRPARAAR